MMRDVSLSEISDGRLYRNSDMVKADTGGCSGCSRCCREMVDTIVIDPWDLYCLIKGEGRSFEELLNSGILKPDMADGLILPYLAPDEHTHACPFLSREERCSIHAYRPGYCRLFPLGRYYEGDDFSYILQIHECDRASGKVKVRKWLDIPELNRYEEYIRQWHNYLRRAGQLAMESEGIRRQICLVILKTFYQEPWDVQEDFYGQFEKRLTAAKHKTGMA